MLLLGGIAAIALTGCELKDDGDNLVNGKTLFVQKCAACHTLARAEAKGVVGPNLDEAWRRSEQDGLGRSTYEGPTGIVGVLHEAFSRARLPSASLWAAVPHYVASTPSPKATRLAPSSSVRST